MKWLVPAMLLALVVLLFLRGIGPVVETVAFFFGLIAGLLVGAGAARPFYREDGHANRTKLVMAWISFTAVFAAAFSLALLLGLTDRGGPIPGLAQGVAWGSVGSFWLTVLLNTVWEGDPRGRAWRFFTWFALAASGTFAGIVAAVLVHRYVLQPLTRYAP